MGSEYLVWEGNQNFGGPEDSSLYQTTTSFLAFTEWIAFYHKCTIQPLTDWLIFEGEQLWLVFLNLAQT